MKRFITVTPKEAPHMESFSFNPDTLAYYNYRAHDENPTYSKVELVFSNSKEVVIIGEAALEIHNHLAALDKEGKWAVETVETPEPFYKRFSNEIKGGSQSE